jgi:glycosyltransferase involved in cell wall biosynthesis
MDMDEPRIAVLIPCRDEGSSIGRVVRDFRAALPSADVYVYDNGSSDDTAERAAAAGAQVRIEPVAGKGNVVRRMFADIDADI